VAGIYSFLSDDFAHAHMYMFTHKHVHEHIHTLTLVSEFKAMPSNFRKWM